eukprot:scaffold5227_cov19-Tisochrysis_lutea.AAC.2
MQSLVQVAMASAAILLLRMVCDCLGMLCPKLGLERSTLVVVCRVTCFTLLLKLACLGLGELCPVGSVQDS